MTYDQETVRTLYKKLLSLYPRAFREQLGESMEQTFNDLCNERKRQTEQGLFGFVLRVFIETAIGIVKEHVLLTTQGNAMKNILTNPGSAAMISFILCLPLAILFPIAVFEIEPFNGLFKTLFTEADGYSTSTLGYTVMCSLMLSLPVAFIVSVAPIVRNLRGSGRLLAHPINLVFAIAIFVVIATIVGGIIVDQYPCWIGVPNCD